MISRVRVLKIAIAAAAGISLASQTHANDETFPATYMVPFGAHWFVSESTTDSVNQLLGSAELIAGPFASEDACNKAKPKDTSARAYKCVSSDAPDFPVRSPVLSSKPAN